METRKELICNALRAFVRQRPGFDPRNYGDAKSYRGDVRPATRALRDAETLIRAVEADDRITADDILKAADGGRLSIEFKRMHSRSQQVAYAASRGRGGIAEMPPPDVDAVVVDWCTGQYWCTEFRPGVARVLASVLWAHTREHCMPAARGDGTYEYTCNGRISAVSAGDWLRAHFRREFGRGIADKYFN